MEVNSPETNRPQLAGMTQDRLSITRRRALGLAAAGLGLAAAPGQAWAGPGVGFPLRAAYLRVGPASFVQIRAAEQDHWSRLALRLGGLVETLMPIQPEDMLGVRAARVVGGPNCAMVARELAARSGFEHVILYATHDGQRRYASDGSWLSDLFATLQADLDKDDPAVGEAHLLHIDGGPPLASVTADAPPRDPLNLFDSGRNPEREALDQLVQGLERRLQDIARRAYDAQRSIAD